MDPLALLRLLQFADSALPIGATAHSFGVEGLTAEGALTVPQIPAFLHAYLEETGALDAQFCRRGFVCQTEPAWIALNAELSAWKPARESRTASLVLGRRFLRLAGSLTWVRFADLDAHLAPAFGHAAQAFGLPPDTAVLAYLHQSTASIVSACQRLLPLGQAQAAEILWEIKPKIAAVTTQSADSTTPNARGSSFFQMLDIASMRHPALATRLFIS